MLMVDQLYRRPARGCMFAIVSDFEAFRVVLDTKQ